jgi:hypothetical protein
MSEQNNTPPLHDVELKFQMQAMTKMMERMNFVMGNVCDRLEKVGKHDNVLEHVPKTRERLGAESKSSSGSRVERPRWAGYEDFKEDVDDTIQARSNSDFDVKYATIQFYTNSHNAQSDRWIGLTFYMESPHMLSYLGKASRYWSTEAVRILLFTSF